MMAKKLLVVFVLFLVSSFLFSVHASAQTTCDLCGKCEGSTAPSDYDQCVECIYESSGEVKSGYSWTILGCVPTSAGGFTQTVLQFVSAIAGGLSFIVFLFGSFKVLTSSGDPEQISSGKSLIASSIIAVLLIVFSVFILRFVGVELLKIPGLGGGG